jgi:tRNA (cmo5U34)-methyltransferase
MDKIFDEHIKQASDFSFNNKVAGVFDDMVTRSVPFYTEMQRMISELAADHCGEAGVIYDLGCSTGTTMIMMDQTVPQHIQFVGIDDSAPMLDKCRLKLEELGMKRPFSLEVADLNSGMVSMENASAVILCLTLQFVRPIAREKLLKSIFDQLNPGGVLIIVEKILAEEPDFNRDFIKY